jgi:hypothetical protein
MEKLAWLEVDVVDWQMAGVVGCRAGRFVGSRLLDDDVLRPSCAQPLRIHSGQARRSHRDAARASATSRKPNTHISTSSLPAARRIAVTHSTTRSSA